MVGSIRELYVWVPESIKAQQLKREGGEAAHGVCGIPVQGCGQLSMVISTLPQTKIRYVDIKNMGILPIPNLLHI